MKSQQAGISKAVIAVSFAALVMLITGFVPQKWITAEFQLPVPAVYLAKTRPLDVFTFVAKNQMEIFKNLTVVFNVTSNMGLFANCKETAGRIMDITLEETDCSSDGAMTWQYVSFGTAMTAILFGTISLIMSILGAVLKRYQGNATSRFAIIVVNFVTSFLALCPVLLYIINKRIQVKPPLPTMISFEPGWALYLTLCGAGVFGLISLMNTYMIVELNRNNDSFPQDDVSNDLKMNGVIENGKDNPSYTNHTDHTDVRF